MRETGSEASQIRRLFRSLEGAMGRQHWWPAEDAFEVVVGAYLTQNTAWTNVQRALGNLRAAEALSIPGIRRMALNELERLLRPAGYFRQKAARLKGFVEHLDASHGGSLERMFAQPTEALREELLGLAGIGPETADSILLYAANREVFVVDSYTRRILARHRLAKAGAPYEQIRLAVQQALAEAGPAGRQSGHLRQEQPHRNAAQEKAPRDDRAPAVRPHAPSAVSELERSALAQSYNELHALLVQTGKHYCLKGEPKCENCPLREMLAGKKPAA